MWQQIPLTIPTENNKRKDKQQAWVQQQGLKTSQTPVRNFLDTITAPADVIESSLEREEQAVTGWAANVLNDPVQLQMVQQSKWWILSHPLSLPLSLCPSFGQATESTDSALT